MADVIDKLYAGTATDADVHSALGWRIIPHAAWSGRIAKVGPGKKPQGVSRVTRDAADALFLIAGGKKEEAVRAAMALNRRLSPSTSGCPVARRICVIALTRPDLRSRYATPSQD